MEVSQQQPSSSPREPWYAKYSVSVPGVTDLDAPRVAVFDFSRVSELPADDWAAVLAVESRGLAATPEDIERAERSKYRQVEVPRITLRDGNSLPLLGLGTWKAERGAVKAAVHTALQAGYRHIDCASIYQNEDEASSCSCLSS
jgi:alcohol dehydrogenase (NADP+)